MRSETQSGPVAKYATSRSSDGIKSAPCGSLDQRSIQWSLVQLPAERLECIFLTIGQVQVIYIKLNLQILYN